jgi:hypothetical protein
MAQEEYSYEPSYPPQPFVPDRDQPYQYLLPDFIAPQLCARPRQLTFNASIERVIAHTLKSPYYYSGDTWMLMSKEQYAQACADFYSFGRD